MKPENQSDKLTEFYRAWLAWAEGRENVHGFKPDTGLCLSALQFGDMSTFMEITHDLCKELGGSISPFDQGLDGCFKYPDKRTNPKRLQWCRDHI